LTGGHYVSYGQRGGKWYCQNDSACKEVRQEQLDKATAYILFYERDGLNIDDYLPSIGKRGPPDTKELDDELEADFKKQCVIM